MKRILLGLTVPVYMIVSACAPTPATPLTARERQAITDTLRAITRDAYAALDALDTARAYARFSERTTGVVDGQLLPPWPDYRPLGIAYLRSLREARDSIQELAVDVLTRDAAVLRGRYAFAYTDTTGVVNAGNAAWSWVFAREPEGWRIVHVHLSYPPTATVQHPVRPPGPR